VKSATTSETDWLVWPVAIALIVSAIAVRVGFFAYPFHNDSGLYAYMGKVVAQGGVLYRDFYENKPPGAAMITSIFWRIFGAWWPGYVLAELALTFVAAAVLARSVRRHAGSHAWLATFLAAIVFFNFGWAVYSGFQLETIQIFFTTLATAAILEALDGGGWADAFVAGLAGGCAAMIKPNGLAVGGAFVIVLLLQARALGWRRTVKLIGSFALGAVVPVSAVVFWVVRTGIAGEMPHLMRQIALYGSGSPMDSFTIFKLLIVGFICLFPLLVRGWVFRRHDATDNTVQPALWAFLLAWGIIELIGIVMQGRMSVYHFLPLAPVGALAYGLLPRSNRGVVLAMSLLPIAFLSMQYRGSDLTQLANATQIDPLSRYLLAHTQRGDSIFVDQTGRVLLETGLNPGTRFSIFYYWYNYDDAPQDYCNGMIRDFQQREPKYIAVGHDADKSLDHMADDPIMKYRPVRERNAQLAWKEFRDYLAAHYQFETQIGKNDLFRRRDTTSSANIAD
jgi:Dolichyl-phosphate-mannose-protein mannosyltransferase